MAEMTESIVQELVARFNPELCIYLRGSRWHWSYRCVSSEDIVNSENGFNDPFQASLHFGQCQSQCLDDLKLEGDYEDEEYLDDAPDDHPGFEVAFLG